MDMNEKTETLLSVIERLCGILVSENENLVTRRFKEIGTTIEDKDRLCRAFELLVKGIVKNGEDVEQADSDLRQSLREHGEQLKILIDDNCAALKTAMNANERLMKAVRKAAVECTPKAGNYTHAGTLTNGSRVDSRTPLPVTINQVL
ncbi:MAG: hypothetical protein H8E30_19095 [Alphaproteobacteria bacterium]|nr:hypothetical protein [Alphaproteobacteria bacterium]